MNSKTTHSSRSRLAETLLPAVVALAATWPVFIDTYRSMIFQTTPRDDYAPYLLHLVGEGGEVPGAPRSYRILSVAVAIPAYHAIPTYRFRKLDEGVDPGYLRATQALAAVSWPASAAILFATVVFARYTSIAGVDPLAMLLIAAAFYWFANAPLFTAIVVLSIGFNEKVWIVATLLVGVRILDARSLRPYRVHAVACVAAIALYFGSVRYLRSPERPSLGRPFLADAPRTLRMTLTAKGMSQNVAPVAMILAACAWTAVRLRGHRSPYWSPVDGLVPLGLAAATA